MNLHSLLRGYLYSVYVDDVRTSQETRMNLHSLLRRYLYFVYVDDVRTSQETHVWVSTDCYGDIFTSFFLLCSYVSSGKCTAYTLRVIDDFRERNCELCKQQAGKSFPYIEYTSNS
jgi:hypothetical protein